MQHVKLCFGAPAALPNDRPDDTLSLRIYYMFRRLESAISVDYYTNIHRHRKFVENRTQS